MRSEPPLNPGRFNLVLAHDLHIRVLNEDGELIRQLTVDPTRDYQRQPKS